MSSNPQEGDWRRSEKQKKERFEEDFLLPFRDEEIRISQRTVDSIETLGATIWDGSIVLSKYLEKLQEEKGSSVLKGKKVLELGSGTGLLGIAASKLGAKVTFTDYSCFDLLNQNIRQNNLQNVSVKRLKWGEQYSSDYVLSEGNIDDNERPPVLLNQKDSREGKGNLEDRSALFEAIIASDLVYYPFLLEPLVITMELLCFGGTVKPLPPEKKEASENEEEVEVEQGAVPENWNPEEYWMDPCTVESPLIFMSAENHNIHSTNRFLDLLSKSFHVERVETGELHRVYQHEDIFVWRISKKIRQML